MVKLKVVQLSKPQDQKPVLTQQCILARFWFKYIQERKYPPFPSSMAAAVKIQLVSAYVHRVGGVLPFGSSVKARSDGIKAALGGSVPQLPFK